MNVTVSIILGSYNRLPFLKATIQSIRENKILVPYEIIVVDGGSKDGSMHWLMKQKDIITIIQHNHGEFHGKPIEQKSWGYFMNLGFKAAQGEYICMISDDSLLIPQAVMNGIDQIKQARKKGQKIGAAAFYWRNSWPMDKDYMVSRTVDNIIFVNHGIYIRAALEEIGWIEDERYQFYCADIDLCLRLHAAGYTILEVPNAFVEHYFHASYSGREQISSIQKKDNENFITYWKAKYPEMNEKTMVLKPKRIIYDDPARTGYRLFPRYSIDKIQIFLFCRRVMRRLRRIGKSMLRNKN